MTYKEKVNMIRELVDHLDYDLSKELYVNSAEEPEFVDQRLKELVSIVDSWLED